MTLQKQEQLEDRSARGRPRPRLGQAPRQSLADEAPHRGRREQPSTRALLSRMASCGSSRQGTAFHQMNFLLQQCCRRGRTDMVIQFQSVLCRVRANGNTNTERAGTGAGEKRNRERSDLCFQTWCQLSMDWMQERPLEVIQ